MYPDFLVIGAQKAGTTWLYANLVPHPRVWMPPVKELHHFDHAPPWWFQRLWSGKDHLRYAREHMVRCLRARLQGRKAPEGDPENLAWALRYCLGRRTDEWYGRLFPRIEGMISGEVCPGYARATEERVARVGRLIPDLKIVYLLRNPVERAWSGLAGHFLRTYGGIEKFPESEIEARFLRPKSRRHGEYTKNLDTWERHFPSDQIWIGFFDDLQRDPAVHLASILEFLGVESSGPGIPQQVEQRVNAGRSEQIPRGIEQLLARHLIDEVRALHARFDNEHTKHWLAYTEERL